MNEQTRNPNAKLLLVGFSHHTAPVELLENISLSEEALEAFLRGLTAIDGVHGGIVIATCNRFEVYIDTDDRDDYAPQVRDALVTWLDVPVDDLGEGLQFQRCADAVRHLFAVASGLDSMVIGEDQILAQVKASLERSQRIECASRGVQQTTQAALRVGKRVRTETELNQAGRSMATVGLSYFANHHGSLDGLSALVIGAGAMGGVIASALRRAGIGDLYIANRTLERAERLADNWDGRAVALADVPSVLGDVDVAVTCTGGVGTLLETADVAAATADRSADEPLLILDLAVPRNVDVACASMPGVDLVDVHRIAEDDHDDVAGSALNEAYAIVEAAITDFVATRSAARVAPALTAMRATASAALRDELDTLTHRVPQLDDVAQQEISRSVQRVLDKLLHRPTVRAKQLASTANGSVYVDVIDDLFTQAT